MRNVASKHQIHPMTDEKVEAPPDNSPQRAGRDNIADEEKTKKMDKAWSSLPALELVDQQGFREEENGEENGDEGLQEVAGKLEIRVVPKQSSNASPQTYQATTNQTQVMIRPQTLPPIGVKATPTQNGTTQNPPMERAGSHERAERKPVERTKSILKQSSKDGSSGGEAGSPRKEVVIFADGVEERRDKEKACHSPKTRIRSPPPDINITDDIRRENETEREVQCDEATAPTACDVADVCRRSPGRSNINMSDKQTATEVKKVETESSSTETDNKDRDRSKKSEERRKSAYGSNLNFEPVESLMRSQSLKSVPSNKPLSSLLNNLAADSRSESSSGASGTNRPKSDAVGVVKEDTEPEGRQRLVDRDKGGRRMEEGVMRCSPGVDLSTNPNVTFVTASSIPELREKRSIANGLSPGMDEQSEYFDATENPTLKDKRTEQDDEDSGVDNASQILRETSTSPAMEGGRISKIPVSVTGGQRLAKCMSWSGDLTPGLRRRRQGEKYVTDPSQLKLRFKRHSSSGLRARGISNCLIDAPESSPESSEGPPPPPPAGEPPAESQVRCRRFRPVT